jgi:hypothetical protein
MSSPVPIALPKDYNSLWANNKPLPLRTSPKKDPFRDPSIMSRVTASGFTESEVTSRLRDSYNSSDLMQEKSDLFDEIVKMREDFMTAKPKLRSSMAEVRNKQPTGDRQFDQAINELDKELLKQAKEQEKENRLFAEEREWERIKEKEDKYRSLSDFKEFTRQLSATVHPSESASNIHQPIRQLGTRGQRQSYRPLSVLDEESALTATNTEQLVVGGYSLSTEDKLRELDTLADIKPVNGLPIIFTNPRLNFLTHIHDALFKILTDSSGQYPSGNCLEILMGSRRKWGDGPSITLLESVIDSTIDTRTGIIKANPFNLPVVEVTMRLTQREMYMSLDLLHKEFEIEWFNTLKAVTTPKFQSKYESMKFKRISHRRDSSSGSNKPSRSSSSSTGRSRRGSGHSEGSILSFLSGR